MRLETKPYQPPTARSLKRSMGLWMATALVIGNMVGSGVFLLPASLAGVARSHGSSSLLAWGFTGTGAMLLALVFANLSRAFPRTGGPYAYARRGLGEFVGFWTAWGYWIAVWAGNAAIAVSFVGYLAVFWPALGSNRALAAVVATAAIWLLTFVNILGAREGGVVQVITTVLKFVPLAIIGIVGLFFIKPHNFGPWAPHGLGTGSGALGGITAAATLTLWGFIGLESATVPAEEVKDPERTIPRATIIGTGATTALYVIATVAIAGIIPVGALANSTSPFADAAGMIFGGSWNKVMAVVAMSATFGALNGWILLQGRVPLAAAQDGLFPKQFAKVSGKRGTPVFGLVVSSILVTGLMAMNYTKSLVDQFTFVVLLATMTTLIPYVFSTVAEVMLFFTEPERFSGRNLARDGAVALLAFGYSLWTIVGAGSDIVTKGFVLLLAILPIYAYLKWRQSREGPAGPVPTAQPPSPAVPLGRAEEVDG